MPARPGPARSRLQRRTKRAAEPTRTTRGSPHRWAIRSSASGPRPRRGPRWPRGWPRSSTTALPPMNRPAGTTRRRARTRCPQSWPGTTSKTPGQHPRLKVLRRRPAGRPSPGSDSMLRPTAPTVTRRQAQYPIRWRLPTPTRTPARLDLTSRFRGQDERRFARSTHQHRRDREPGLGRPRDRLCRHEAAYRAVGDRRSARAHGPHRAGLGRHPARNLCPVLCGRLCRGRDRVGRRQSGRKADGVAAASVAYLVLGAAPALLDASLHVGARLSGLPYLVAWLLIGGLSLVSAPISAARDTSNQKR